MLPIPVLVGVVITVTDMGTQYRVINLIDSR